MNSAAVNNDCSRFLTVSFNKIYVCDTFKLKIILELQSDCFVVSALFNPDSSRIASSNGNGTVQIWDA